eukprot:TRINITY_DN625_c0_g1_i1.p1 TRINITY_DN625_c0_g1~~TRINITY_DN625_c0_g1_i1.p1  ORF type:complete len:449 (+),score=66.70 TRINITY_DN625_c0_g1_i1:48-1394(+)
MMATRKILVKAISQPTPFKFFGPPALRNFSSYHARLGRSNERKSTGTRTGQLSSKEKENWRKYDTNDKRLKIQLHQAIKQGYKATKDAWQASRSSSILDIITCTNLINVFGGEWVINQTKEAKDLLVDVLETMNQNHMEPDQVIYGKLIHIYAKVKDIACMELYFEDMKKCGIPPNSIIYSSMIDGYSKTGNIDKMLSTYRQMRNEGMVPNIVIHTSMIKGFQRAGMKEEEEKMKSEFKSMRFHMDVFSYTDIIYEHAKEGNVEGMLSAYKKMRSEGITPTVVTFNNLFRGYIAAKDLAGIDMVVKEMDNFDIQPSAFTFSILIHGFRKLKRLDLMRQIYRKMKVVGVEPSIVIFNDLIKAHCYHDMNTVQKLLQEMEEIGVHPDATTYSILLDALLAKNEIGKMRTLYEQAIKDGIEPEAFSPEVIQAVQHNGQQMKNVKHLAQFFV